jgi:hypothetical protein
MYTRGAEFAEPDILSTMTAPQTPRPLVARAWIPIVAILLAIGAWKANGYWRDSRDQATIVSQCRTAYAAATSAADSLKVDGAVPGVGQAQAAERRSCGTLRQSGKL